MKISILRGSSLLNSAGLIHIRYKVLNIILNPASFSLFLLSFVNNNKIGNIKHFTYTPIPHFASHSLCVFSMLRRWWIDPIYTNFSLWVVKFTIFTWIYFILQFTLRRFTLVFLERINDAKWGIGVVSVECFIYFQFYDFWQNLVRFGIRVFLTQT